MNQNVSNRQIFAFIIISLQGLPVISLPHDMAVNAGTGSWFTLVLATLIFLIPVMLISSLNRKFPGKTLIQYIELLVGKPLGIAISVLYAMYFFIFFAYTALSAAEVIKADVLYDTPMNLILIVFIATSLYVTSRGLSNLGRILEVVMLILLPVTTFLCALMLLNGDKYNLMPFFNPSKAGAYLKALPFTLPAFAGYEALVVLPFYSNNSKLGRRYALGGIVAAGITYILVTESCYSILGLADIVNYNDAMVVAIQRIDAPYLEIFRRVDLIFLVAWMVTILGTLNLYNYVVHDITCSFFPQSRKWLILIITGVAAFTLAALPSCSTDATKYFYSFLFALAPVTGIVVPGLLLIMTRIRKHVVPQNR